MCSAFASALDRVLATKRADLRGTSASSAWACRAFRPWICRTTSRIFCADMRTFSVLAWTSMKLLRLGLRGVRAVLLEDPGWRKLAEPVAHHVFRDEDRVEDFAVVHVERQSDEIRRDHRTARPGLDWRLGPRLFGLRDLVGQMMVNERAFFYRSSHRAQVGDWGDGVKGRCGAGWNSAISQHANRPCCRLAFI